MFLSDVNKLIKYVQYKKNAMNPVYNNMKSLRYDRSSERIPQKKILPLK